MTPQRIITSIHLGVANLAKDHSALKFLWRKFSSAIREERIRRGIKLKDFALGLGVTSTYAGYLEKNRREWSVERAELAIKLLTRRENWPDAAPKP